MAIDIQTKLVQTKLKLFGLNPNEDDYDLLNQNITNKPGSSEPEAFLKSTNNFDNLSNYLTKKIFSFKKNLLR